MICWEIYLNKDNGHLHLDLQVVETQPTKTHTWPVEGHPFFFLSSGFELAPAVLWCSGQKTPISCSLFFWKLLIIVGHERLGWSSLEYYEFVCQWVLGARLVQCGGNGVSRWKLNFKGFRVASPFTKTPTGFFSVLHKTDGRVIVLVICSPGLTVSITVPCKYVQMQQQHVRHSLSISYEADSRTKALLSSLSDGANATTVSIFARWSLASWTFWVFLL